MIRVSRRCLSLTGRLSEAARPDPTIPKYFDKAQSGGRKSYAQFKEEATKKYRTGDNKRLLPLKTLVPEEYRGARYYTDREMEFVDPRNAKPKLFAGPWSVFFPHRDGRIECDGDRVPCSGAIRRSYQRQQPLLMEDGFEDQSRYGKFKQNPKSNPRKQDQINYIFKWLMSVLVGCFFYYKFWYCPTNNIEFSLTNNEILLTIIMAPIVARLSSNVLQLIRYRLLRR